MNVSVIFKRVLFLSVVGFYTLSWAMEDLVAQANGNDNNNSDQNHVNYFSTLPPELKFDIILRVLYQEINHISYKVPTNAIIPQPVYPTILACSLVNTDFYHTVKSAATFTKSVCYRLVNDKCDQWVTLKCSFDPQAYSNNPRLVGSILYNNPMVTSVIMWHPETRDKNGHTLLNMALQRGELYRTMVQLLIERGAQITDQDIETAEAAIQEKKAHSPYILNLLKMYRDKEIVGSLRKYERGCYEN